MRATRIGLIAAMLLCTAPVAAQQPGSSAAERYAPYEFLIGDWVSDGGPMKIRQSFSWGPSKSYIRYSTYTTQTGRPERLHFEGIMVWNAKSKALDYLFAIEPGSGAQERGHVHPEADGSVVREVELTRPDGKTGQFRQTFRRVAEDQAVTSMMRNNAGAWEPTFPGSERLAMTRVNASH